MIEIFDELKNDELSNEIFNTLLKDRTTNKNIIWGTNNYRRHGIGYFADDYITIEKITGKHSNLIKSRVEKSSSVQKKRSKDMAEVFTPSWMCNMQNNLVDDKWFDSKNVFNKENGFAWKPSEKILFKTRTWEMYVKDIRLEVACGESPYLTSRYDMVTGKSIPVSFRIGLLDRKLRVISENVKNEKDWIKYATIAYKSIYGFDYQGDNVLISRINLLLTYIENFNFNFGKNPSENSIKNISNILSWNIWQMDGLKFVIPNSCHKEGAVQMTLFGEEEKPDECPGCKKNDIYKHNGNYCYIKDWVINKRVKFIDLIKGA